MNTDTFGIGSFEDAQYIKKYGRFQWAKKCFKNDLMAVKLLGIIAVVLVAIGIALFLCGSFFAPLAIISIFPFGLAGFVLLMIVFELFFRAPLEFLLNAW